MEAPDYGVAKEIDCAASVSLMEQEPLFFKDREKPEKGVKWKILSLFVINWKSRKGLCRFLSKVIQFDELIEPKVNQSA